MFHLRNKVLTLFLFLIFSINAFSLTYPSVHAIQPPTIDSFTPLDVTPEVDEGGSLPFTHTSSDPDEDPLTYSWLLEGVEQVTTLDWTYLPGYDSAGLYNVTLAVSDGEFMVTQEWVVAVGDVNRPPTNGGDDILPILIIVLSQIPVAIIIFVAIMKPVKHG